MFVGTLVGRYLLKVCNVSVLFCFLFGGCVTVSQCGTGGLHRGLCGVLARIA